MSQRMHHAWHRSCDPWEFCAVCELGNFDNFVPIVSEINFSISTLYRLNILLTSSGGARVIFARRPGANLICGAPNLLSVLMYT